MAGFDYTGFGRAVVGVPILIGRILLMILWVVARIAIFLVAFILWAVGLGLIGLSGWIFSWYWSRNWFDAVASHTPSQDLMNASRWISQWETDPKAAWRQFLTDICILKGKDSDSSPL